MNIRTANPGDLEGLLTLYKELRPNDPPVTHDRLQAALTEITADPRLHIVVAEQQGMLHATCMLAITPSLAVGARPFGLIEHVVTLKDSRGRGFAQAILDRALELAWQANCYKVMLLSGFNRPEAHKLYLKLGFDGDRERGFVIKAPH